LGQVEAMGTRHFFISCPQWGHSGVFLIGIFLFCFL
jgi:hypothetical protein